MTPTTSQAPPKAKGSEARPPIDPRFRARRVEVKRSAGRRRLRRLQIAGLVAGALVLLASLTLTPVLDVDQVEVTGEFRTPVDDIVSAGGISEGSPMVMADLGRAARRIEALPWVASADVTRSWPGTIHVAVVEREPAAVVLSGEDRWLAADAEGRIVAELESRPADLPEVEGTHTGTEVGGVTDDADQLAFAVAAALPQSVRPLVSSVSWDGQAATIHLVDGGTATMGGSGELEAKGVALASVLAARDPACVATIDVSLPTAPVLTSVPGCG